MKRLAGENDTTDVATTGRMVITDMDTGPIMVMAIDATAGAISWEPRANRRVDARSAAEVGDLSHEITSLAAAISPQC